MAGNQIRDTSLRQSAWVYCRLCGNPGAWLIISLLNAVAPPASIWIVTLFDSAYFKGCFYTKQ